MSIPTLTWDCGFRSVSDASVISQVLPLVITDVSFLDERGLLFGFYWGTQSCVNAVFTVTVSYLAAGLGWRSVATLRYCAQAFSSTTDNSQDGSTGS
jgi:hypothetical protein